jgi:hypothetical protein
VGEYVLDPLYLVETSEAIDKRTKKSIGLKIKKLSEVIAQVEQDSGLRYPSYYVDPVLTVVPSVANDDVDGLTALYARTIPVQVQDRVQIVVEFAAPLLLYATKATLHLVVSHELLHYIELVKNFTSMDIVSDLSSSSVYEERFTDSSRAVRASFVFKNKRFAKKLEKRTSAGLDDPKLNEKCRVKWIEKLKPTRRIFMGTNQVKIPVESIIRTDFDPKVREIVSLIERNN